MQDRTYATMALLVTTLGFPTLASAVPVTIDFDPGSGVYSSVAPGGNNVYMEDGFTFATPPGTATHCSARAAGPQLEL